MKAKKAQKRTVFGVYARHIKPYPLLTLGVVLGTIVMQVIYLVAPLYLRQFFNLLSNTPSPAVVEQLLATLGIIIAVWFADWAVHRAHYFCLAYLEIRVMADLYRSSFDYLLGHSHNFFVSHFAGSLTHRVSKFTKSFETLCDATFGSFSSTFIFVVGAIGILFMRHHLLGIILAVWTVCFLVFQFYVAHLRRPSRVARAEADSRMTGNLADAISNQGTIMLFAGARHESERFGKTVAQWAERYRRSWTIDGYIWLGIGLLMIAVQSALMYVGVRLWQQGLFTIGDFVLVQAYLLTVFARLDAINRELRRSGDAYSDAVEMVNILNTLHEVHDEPGARPLVVSEGEITFDKVSFHFHEERGIFRDFDLRIAGREKVALVGPSGAGKSTITKLILRLFDVKSGSIRIDGQDIRHVTQESLRNAIAFVPQEPVLFHRTLMENIRYGRRDASDEEVFAAAREAHCHDFISALPQGYDTYVGERGVKLSGGERQRVAIARAILKNAPILILDEATSSLDSASELLIQDALAHLMEGKTVIVIAHRLSTIMRMDRIVALDNGAIQEEGTHQELVERGGLYAKLWNHQAGGFLQEDGEE